VSEAKAPALLAPLAERYNGYFVLNRTYYRINEANCKGLAAAGRLWQHRESGTLVIAGARFQSDKALQIPLIEGDRARGLAFAHLLASQRGASRLVCNFALENPPLEAFLQDNSFTAVPDLMVMEVTL